MKKQSQKPKEFSKSIRKFIRIRKQEIHRTIIDPTKQKEEIKKIYEKALASPVHPIKPLPKTKNVEKPKKAKQVKPQTKKPEKINKKRYNKNISTF